MPHFAPVSQMIAEIMAVCQFFNMAAVRHVGFLKVRNLNLINAKREVALNFGLRPKSKPNLPLKPRCKTRVCSKTKLNLSNPVSNETVLMHLDRQLSLIS